MIEVYINISMDVKLLSIDDYFSSEITENENLTTELISRHNIKYKTTYKNYINAQQPGTGKTTKLIEELESITEGQDLVIASNHNFLAELKSNLKREMVIMKGFSKGCARYNENANEGKLIKKMHDEQVPNKVICACMKCKCRCHYREQFDKYKEPNIVVGMPVQLIHLYDDFSNFNSVHIEERVQGDYDIQWDTKKILKEIYKLKTYFGSKKFNQVIEYINTKNYANLFNESENIQKIVEKYNMDVVKYFEKMPNNKFINQICKLKINNLLMFLEFEDRRKKQKYFEPSNIIIIPYQQLIFYKQLNFNIPLFYNCATFPKTEFLFLLKGFEEMFSEYTGVVEITTSHIKNKENFKIIKHNNSGFYKSYIQTELKEYEPKIKNLIKNIRARKTKKICFLTYMNLVKDGKFMGCDAFYFGSSHGVNKYRNYDVLIVYGTNLPDNDTWIEYFQEHHPYEEVPDFNDWISEDGRHVPRDERLQQFYVEKFEEDVYDSVHRLRPLWRKVEVHWFGMNIPQRLIDEASYEERG